MTQSQNALIMLTTTTTSVNGSLVLTKFLFSKPSFPVNSSCLKLELLMTGWVQIQILSTTSQDVVTIL